jgi:hypothetical protein
MKLGATAPDLELLRPGGTPARLVEFCTSEYLLLVFLRHLA